MPADAKYLEVADTLEERLRSGGYMLHNIRSERRLAEEMGISHMTARKAVQQLLERGLLERKSNGRLKLRDIAPQSKNGPKIGFIAPAWPSVQQLTWQKAIMELVAAKQGVVRPILYVNPSDSIVFDALASDLDGLFVLLPRQFPPLVQARLVENKNRIVVLFHDLTHLGIPSIENCPGRFVSLLLDHLQTLGHRRIDALSLDVSDSVLESRVEHWRYGLEQRGLQGQLWRIPNITSSADVEGVRSYVEYLLKQPNFNPTALFGLTTEIAWAAMRACYEKGLRIGKDISICGFGEMHFAKMAIPSITVVQPAERTPLINAGLEWMMNGGKNWSRPLRLEPEKVSLFIGESTGQALI